MQQFPLLKYILILIGLATIQSANAQSYDLAAGVRLGSEIGVSVKMRVPPVDKNFTGEFIVQSSFDGDEVLMTLLGEQHMAVISRRLNVYTGLGMHAGWVQNELITEDSYDAPLGVSFIGGVEVNFKRLNVSLDYKPVINVKGGERFFQSSSALTLRYMAFQRNDIFTSPRKKRQKQRVKKRKQKAKSRAKSGKKGWQFWKKND